MPPPGPRGSGGFLHPHDTARRIFRSGRLEVQDRRRNGVVKRIHTKRLVGWAQEPEFRSTFCEYGEAQQVGQLGDETVFRRLAMQ